ncbi:hypothetical protein E2C01_033430 [Portunus trituberculatus]|uniref:Uncharacterized protein n=1 Tax=Portunus trituberculatus TaxID=210409 RepID=A0A5B7F418_PORTR|nr:hypothetical protein [Portunus trituberculatus]
MGRVWVAGVVGVAAVGGKVIRVWGWEGKVSPSFLTIELGTHPAWTHLTTPHHTSPHHTTPHHTTHSHRTSHHTGRPLWVSELVDQ